MKNVFKHCTVQHFAVVTNLLYASKDIKTVPNVVNEELKELVIWLMDWETYFKEFKAQYFSASYDNIILLLIISKWRIFWSFLLNQWLI